MRCASNCEIGSLLSYPRDHVGSARTCSRSRRAFARSASGETRNCNRSSTPAKCWPSVAPYPAGARCEWTRAPTLNASALRSNFSSGDWASRANTSATSSTGCELEILRPCIATRCAWSGATSTKCASPVPASSIDWRSSCPSRFQSSPQTAARASSPAPRPESTSFPAASRRYGTAPSRSACRRRCASRSHFAPTPAQKASSRSGAPHSITTESASASTFHDGFAMRSEDATISAVSGEPS